MGIPNARQKRWRQEWREIIASYDKNDSQKEGAAVRSGKAVAAETREQQRRENRI